MKVKRGPQRLNGIGRKRKEGMGGGVDGMVADSFFFARSACLPTIIFSEGMGMHMPEWVQLVPWASVLPPLGAMRIHSNRSICVQTPVPVEACIF